MITKDIEYDIGTWIGDTHIRVGEEIIGTISMVSVNTRDRKKHEVHLRSLRTSEPIKVKGILQVTYDGPVIGYSKVKHHAKKAPVFSMCDLEMYISDYGATTAIDGDYRTYQGRKISHTDAEMVINCAKSDLIYVTIWHYFEHEDPMNDALLDIHVIAGYLLPGNGDTGRNNQWQARVRKRR